MRKIVAHLMVSIDGDIQGPDRWSYDYFNEELMASMVAQLDAQDAVLLGRVSYEQWASYWPTSTDEPFASFINHVPKYVVSSTLDKVQWNNSTLLKGNLEESLLALKAQPGKNISVQASPTLIESLLELDLLDELRLSIFPVIAGEGRRLFQDGGNLKRMKLFESKTSSLGVVMNAYAPERSSMGL